MNALAITKDWLRRTLLIRLRWLGAYDALMRLEAKVFGRKVRLEVCSKCQLACPSCSTAKGETRTGAVGWGQLRAEDFRRFLERNPKLRVVELSNWGEIFLNPELAQILAIAHEKGVPVEATNGVNLNTAREDALEAVVRHGVRRITVSIDGASDETYRQYRVNGNLERVLRHVDRINHHKTTNRSRFPELTWQFIVFGHNEHEIPKAREMALARGMRFLPIRNLDFDRSPVRDASFVKRETGIDTSVDGERVLEGLARRLDFCHQLWDAPQVNWDGKLLGCCFNNYKDFGNVFEMGLAAALEGEAYRHTKKVVLGLAKPRPDSPCTGCPVYAGFGAPAQGKAQRRVIPLAISPD